MLPVNRNMKVNLLFLVLVGAATLQCVFSSVPSSSRKVEIQSCKDKTNATEDAQYKFISMKSDLVNSREGKCFLACTMEVFGLMRGDGSIDNEKARQIFHQGSFGGYKDIFDAWKFCQTIVAGRMKGKCDYAFDVYSCFFRTRDIIETERYGITQKNRLDCMQESNLTLEVYMRSYRHPSSNDTHELKCMIKCEWEKMGALGVDGSINPERLMRQRFHWYFDRDSTLVKKYIDTIKKCESSGFSKVDRCVYAYEISKCFSAGIRKKRSTMLAW